MKKILFNLLLFFSVQVQAQDSTANPTLSNSNSNPYGKGWHFGAKVGVAKPSVGQYRTYYSAQPTVGAFFYYQKGKVGAVALDVAYYRTHFTYNYIYRDYWSHRSYDAQKNTVYDIFYISHNYRVKVKNFYFRAGPYFTFSFTRRYTDMSDVYKYSNTTKTILFEEMGAAFYAGYQLNRYRLKPFVELLFILNIRDKLNKRQDFSGIVFIMSGLTF